MNGCRTEFTQGGVNVFKDYQDDKFGERVLKVMMEFKLDGLWLNFFILQSGRHGFTGWQGFGGSVIQWHTQLKIGKA